jgi:hypothetical protein
MSVVVDLIRERKPRFVAADVIAEFATILRTYRIASILSDRFGGGLTSDDWTRNGVTFQGSVADTSENYLRALPMLTSRRAHLLDHAALRSQLSGLERRIVGGHEKIDHPQVSSAHDDVATAVCGALVMASRAAMQEVPFVVPFIASRPRYFPGSDYRGASKGVPNTPAPPGFRPSSGPWADYLARRDRWSPDW